MSGILIKILNAAEHIYHVGASHPSRLRCPVKASARFMNILAMSVTMGDPNLDVLIEGDGIQELSSYL